MPDSTAEESHAGPKNALSRRSLLLLGVALVCMLAMWLYTGLLGWRLIPLGNEAAPYHSDLYDPWYGVRELLLHGRDPYSDEVTRGIQLGHFGRVLDGTHPADYEDQHKFAYPIYVAFLLAPFVDLEFATVQQWLVIASLFGLALSVPVWIALLRLRFTAGGAGAAVLLTLGSFSAVTALAGPQLALAVLLLILGALVMLHKGWYFPAGALLALSTIKPQMVAPLLAGLAVWMLLDLRRRQGLGWGFAVAMAGLLAGAELMSPGWMGKFLERTADYQVYTQARPLSIMLFGGPLGGLLMAALAAWVLSAWLAAGRARGWGRDMAVAVSLTLAATLLIVPMALSYHELLLLPAILVLYGRAGSAWQRGGRPVRYAYVAVTGIVGWQWLAAIGIVTGAICGMSFQGEFGAALRLPLYNLLIMPFAVVLAFALAIGGGILSRRDPAEGAVGLPARAAIGAVLGGRKAQVRSNHG